jgi:hypothetical protein
LFANIKKRKVEAEAAAKICLGSTILCRCDSATRTGELRRLSESELRGHIGIASAE